MPEKLPSPSAGTAVQPAPKGSSLAGSAIGLLLSIEPELSGADDELLSGAELSLAALVSSEPQALRVTARVEAEARRMPRVRVLFTFDVLLGRRTGPFGDRVVPAVVPPGPFEGSGEASAAGVAETSSGGWEGCCPAGWLPAGRDR
jgi:hypothetical protein